MNDIFVNLAGLVRSLLEGIIASVAIIELSMGLFYAVATFTFIALAALVLVFYERKVAAYLQERIGPNRVGPRGALQTVADMLKLLGKETIIPKNAQKWPFLIAPVLFMVPAMLVYAVVPFGEGMVAADIEYGVLYFIAVSALATLVLVMAGWASSNKYSLMGGMRAVAQMVSYELPLVFSVLGVVMLTGSMRFSSIVAAQEGLWFIFLQPVGFVIFFIACLAELNRAPFDLVEGETELTGGVFTEYSPMQFAVFFMAEYANIVIVSAVAVTLFFGGWMAPFGLDFIPSYVWFLAKIMAMITVIMWIRWSLPRFRIDHLMGFSWKILLPLAIVNMIVTGIVIYVIV